MLILGDMEQTALGTPMSLLSRCAFLIFKYLIFPPTTRFQGRSALPCLCAFDIRFPYFWGYFSSLCFVNYELPIFNLQIIWQGQWDSTSQNRVPTKLNTMFSMPHTMTSLKEETMSFLTLKTSSPKAHPRSCLWNEQTMPGRNQYQNPELSTLRQLFFSLNSTPINTQMNITRKLWLGVLTAIYWIVLRNSLSYNAGTAWKG